MDGAILTFPLRAGLVGTSFVLRAAGCTLKLGGRATVVATGAAVRAVGRLSDEVAWGRPAPELDPSAPPTTPAAETLASDLESRVVEPDIPLEPEVPLAQAEPETVVEPEPPHVSEEPELIEEIAEPGAEDGAGASIEIAEPWPGYRALTAADVVARIDDATPAELAGIELYESAHRNRQTVLAAAQRSLKTKTGRGSPDRRE